MEELKEIRGDRTRQPQKGETHSEGVRTVHRGLLEIPGQLGPWRALSG